MNGGSNMSEGIMCANIGSNMSEGWSHGGSNYEWGVLHEKIYTKGYKKERNNLTLNLSNLVAEYRVMVEKL